MKPYRSVLFLPGHRSDWVDKATAAGADAIVLDLEDAVPDHLKPDARQAVSESIARLHEQRAQMGVFVRPNGLQTRLTGLDLEAAIAPGLTGIFAPKVQDAADVYRYEALLDHFEARSGVANLELIIPVETAAAMQNCSVIAAASPRVGAMVGAAPQHADVAREIGYQWTPEGLETLYMRSRVLLACRAARVHPLTGLWEDIRDIDGLRAFAAQGRQLGFRGQIVIHPSHVQPVNEIFTPPPEEVAFYRGLIDAYTEASEHGAGAVVYRGVHIDVAHAETARQWLEHAAAITQLNDDPGRG
jgi:citrate lyase subunit beta / citryl-CoA lyase